jgi:alanine-synthesizing transaminase
VKQSVFFARRTCWNLSTNRYTEALEGHRRAGREVLDLTASNPTTVGLQYREEELLRALANREALRYEPQPKGLRAARTAIADYYAERDERSSPDLLDRRSPASPNDRISPDDLILTTSTSEAYSFVFRLLCNPGDALLVPTPSYPLFDFLADIQDVKLVPYELIYDHGWQIDFPSLRGALERAKAAGERCRAVLVVHPNNPTGSYVKQHEAEELNRICVDHGLAIIADEVFLDYSLLSNIWTTGATGAEAPVLGTALGTAKAVPLQSPPSVPAFSFSSNHDVLTFAFSGLSKISALPQMKVAWIAVSGPQEVKRDALARLEVIADTYLSMNAPVQLAVPTMLEERHNIQAQLMQRIRTNLQELDSQLAAQKLCRRLEVEGGWYAILRVPAIASDEDLAIALLQQRDVLVQPGHFYDFAADGHLVISLITEAKIFRTALTRLFEYVATLGH